MIEEEKYITMIFIVKYLIILPFSVYWMNFVKLVDSWILIFFFVVNMEFEI